MKDRIPCVLFTSLLLSASAAQAERRLSLKDAIAVAQQHRSEMTQTGIDRERAELGVLRAQLERIHLRIQATAQEQVQDINIQATGTTPDSSLVCMFSPSSCDSEAHQYGGSADLTIPIWSGFTIESDIARARWLSRAAEAQRQVTGRTIALDVAHAYWALRRAELLRDVEAEAVRRDEEEEAIIGARVRSGIAPHVDYNRAHVATLREVGQLRNLEGQVAEGRAQLAGVLQIEEPIALTEDPEAHAGAVPELAPTLEVAQRTRPELAVAKAQAVAQAEAVRAARGTYWPQLALFGHADIANANIVFATLPQEQLFANLSAGIRLQWTIFDTLTTWATVRDAEYQQARYEADRVRAGVVIDTDVKAAHARLARTLAQKPPLVESVKVARDNLEIIRKRYEAGDALVIELLDAQVQLLRSESDLVDNAVAIATATAELASAQGRL
jgi:outer membrane protein TolC